jgi:hypothetical protein
MPKVKKNEEEADTNNSKNESLPQEEIKENLERKSITNSLKFKRDENGLLLGKEYEFTDDGLVNWRKMIDSKYLVPNLSKFPSGTENKNLNVHDLEDSQLLILLGGIKDLANIRGYSKVKYKVFNCTQNHVAVSCKITWTPNFETSGQEVEFESLADAHLDNTKSFAKDFLMAIAENRAFVRSVRNFLRINILGSDELGDSKNQTVIHTESGTETQVSASHPSNVLKETMAKANITFEVIKETLIKEGINEAANWDSVSEIPHKTIFSLIQRIKKKINT